MKLDSQKMIEIIILQSIFSWIPQKITWRIFFTTEHQQFYKNHLG